MRVLVGAARADQGTTSEGLCTARVVRLLADRGHVVRLVVGAAADGDEARETAGGAVGGDVEVGVAHLGSSSTARVGRWAARRGGRFRTDVLVQAATGFGLDELATIRAWAKALRHEETAWAPDVTYVRGAGLDLTPLLARQAWSGPWVGHLHDPWPRSWYPPSYAEHSALVSARQQGAARRVLRRAPVLTVPSARLATWLAARAGVDLAGRVEVVAHLGASSGPAAAASGPPAPWPERPCVLAHVGTLLGPRDPGPLLEGWRRVVDGTPGAREEVGVAFVGPLDRRHLAGGRPRFLAALGDAPWQGAVTVHPGRCPQPVAAAAVAAAAAGVVLEGPDPVSPFAPAKVSDLLVGGGPVLALTRSDSPTADLVGADHPLRVDPDDPGAIARAIERVWRAWRDGTSARLRPPSTATVAVGRAAVGEALDRAFEAAVSGAASDRTGR